MVVARPKTSSSIFPSQVPPYKFVGWHDSEFLALLFGLDWAEASTQHTVTQLLQLMGQHLADQATGIVADPRTGQDLARVKPPEAAWMLRLSEFQTESTIAAAPKFLPHWSVENIKNDYGVVYVQLFYHPSEPAALAKKQLVAETYDFCQYHQVPLFLDLALTQLEPDEDREQVLLQTLSELRDQADLLGLPYPGSPLLAATVSAELDVPWLLSSGGQTYDEFKTQLRDAIENGAQGYLISASLYRELEACRLPDHSPDWLAIESFISTTARDRLIELSRIVDEAWEKQSQG